MEFNFKSYLFITLILNIFTTSYILIRWLKSSKKILFFLFYPFLYPLTLIFIYTFMKFKSNPLEVLLALVFLLYLYLRSTQFLYVFISKNHVDYYEKLGKSLSQASSFSMFRILKNLFKEIPFLKPKIEQLEIFLKKHWLIGAIVDISVILFTFYLLRRI